jgi:DNA processing protein
MIGVGLHGPVGIDAGAAPAKLSAGCAPSRRLPATVRRLSSVSGWNGFELDSLDVERERPFWLTLGLVPGVGPVGFGRLLARFGSAEAAWNAGEEALAVLPRSVPEAAVALRRLRGAGPEAIARRIITAAAKAGARAITALDTGYPPPLARLDPRPPVLYVAGDAEVLAGFGVAIVGTRRPSGYGRSCAIEIADELARAGVVVVSGLALGIDGEAHRAAVAAGGRSVAVLPAPIDRIYPPRHRSLAQQLVAGGGALVTELAPGQPVGRPDFARRNRIIAGLAAATVVVEAPDRSGALLTASAAVDQGRDLYAVPGPIDAAASRGCNRLIADQLATLVTSVPALLQQLGASRGVQRPTIKVLSETEGIVLYALLQRSGSIEELMSRTRLPTGALASALTLLESRGLATSYGGATFHPTLAARRLAPRA